jgi:hypothetical protein
MPDGASMNLYTLIGVIYALVAGTLSGAEKKPVTAQGANDGIALQALAVLEKDDIKQVFGSDFGGFIVAVELTLTPKSGKPLKVSRDDFVLRSYKDGQKSQPFAPAQIAGKGGLMISTVGGGRGAWMGNQNGPVYGGLGGDRPRRLGGDGGAIGNVDAQGTQDAALSDGGKDKDDPTLAALKQKALREGETTEAVKGYLYFPLEGKHKAKDIALVYNGPAGKLALEFRQ